MLRRALPFILVLGCSSTREASPAPTQPDPSEPRTPPEADADADDADAPSQSSPPVTVFDSDLDAAAASLDAFSTDLYGRVSDARGNLILSPASVAMALGMTYQGATGETAAELRTALRVEASNLEPQTWHAAMGQLGSAWTTPPPGDHRTPPPEVALANRLFGADRLTFEQPFLEASERAYGAPMERLDFSAPDRARTHINDWVEDQTHDRIVDLIPRSGVDADTALVLANAVYFKGQWQHTFKEGATHDAPFSTAAGKAVDVPTMRNTASYRYAATDDVTLVELPYTGGGFAMLIAMPSEPAGLGALEDSLDPATLRAWQASLQSERIALSMPKFRIEPSSSLALGKALREMGLRRAFTDAAQFDRMVTSADAGVKISGVFHKGFIKVDENGTEAAAATAVGMTTTSIPAKPKPLAIDRPFMFFLRHAETGTILFMGRVVDPR